MNLHDEIAAVAYELYVAGGCVPGRDLDNWLDAERLVLVKHAGQDIEEPEEEADPETAEVKKTKVSEESYVEENQEAA